jgi:hypothetical protein
VSFISIILIAILDKTLYHQSVSVSGADAIATAKALACKEGNKINIVV